MAKATPRQFLNLVESRGVRSGASILLRFRNAKGAEPIFDRGLAFALVFKLWRDGNEPPTGSLFRTYTRCGVAVGDEFLDWIRILELSCRRKGPAIETARELIRLDPGNPKAKAALDKLLP